MTDSISKTESNCPPDGTCKIEVLKNKSLVVKKDDIGAIYYQLIDDVTKNVIHYEYNQTSDENLEDGGLREEILFEVDQNSSELQLSSMALQQTKMLYGRHCYCKGGAGYFKVENGTLTISKTNKNKHSLLLDFKVSEVPQTISTIKAQY